MQPLHLRYLELIRRLQWLAPDKLLTYQARLLEDIARHAYEAVPFYRERLAPLFPRGEFDLRGWRDVSVVFSRADVMSNAEAFGGACGSPWRRARDGKAELRGQQAIT